MLTTLQTVSVCCFSGAACPTVPPLPPSLSPVPHSRKEEIQHLTRGALETKS